MQSRRVLPVILGLALLALAPSGAAAQRLGAVSSAVHGGGGGGFGSSGGSRGSSGYRGYGYGGYGRGGYGGYGGVQFGGSPWVSLYFPYYLGYAGTSVRQDAMVAGRTFQGPAILGIVDASAGYVFDGVVRGQVSGRVRFGGILDLEGRYGAYFEQTGADIRALGIARLAVAFPFVSEANVALRGGIAGQLYHDAAGVELGYAGLLELDAYPIEPLVIHVEGSAGALGQAVMVDARATIGMQIDRGELYVGYQVFAVDPFVTAGTALHGPIAGVRVWIS